MKLKLTKLEKFWILYDVGNSAFVLMISTMVPLYFNYLAELADISSVNYLAYWGYAASIATIAVALIGPIAGTIADTQHYKKWLWAGFIALGVICCVCLGFMQAWLPFLIIYIIAKIGYSSANIFYDSMLTDITTEERMDDISAQGYAWGYIGSCIPFLSCLVLVLGAENFGLTMNSAMMLSFCITALWWALSSLPLMKHYRQKHFIPAQKGAVRSSLQRLFHTVKNMRKEKHIFLFLLAFFFYIDGVYTIIDMATAYGAALGLDSNGLLGALLVSQIVAFPCSIFFGRLAKKYDIGRLITVCICAYLCITIFAFFMTSQFHFWILAICVGMFQGGVQALSRSYFAHIIPPEKSGEYFGIMDICGKGASFLGTTLAGLVSQLTGSINYGVGSIILILIIGLILFRKAVKAA